MRKIGFFFLLLCVHEISFAQFNQNDTLFFVRDKTDSYYHRIFIDTNKESVFYSYIADFTIVNFDIDSYKSSLAYLYANKLFPRKNRVKDLPEEWVELEIYKGKTYVYSPADFYTHYKVKLTDSVWIDWTGEGPEATYIQSVTEGNSLTWQFVLKSQSYPQSEVTVQYIDKTKGIALFQRKYFNRSSKKIEVKYQLMVDVKKMKGIPLLVNTCDNLKQDELEFDKIDYARMFKRN